MQITCDSDMTAAGTMVTVDGKKNKGKLEYFSFSFCKRMPFESNGMTSDPEYDLSCTATYSEEDVNGTCKRVTYNYHNHDDVSVIEDKLDPAAAMPAIMDMLRGNKGSFTIKG